MMMNGSRKLLNCAASTRKIRTSASTAAFHRRIALVTQLARLAAVVDRVTGRQDLRRLRLQLLQRLVDARAHPVILTELSCWKRLSVRGCTVSLSVAIVASGMSCPLRTAHR
jgi:hypothetical protein